MGDRQAQALQLGEPRHGDPAFDAAAAVGGDRFVVADGAGGVEVEHLAQPCFVQPRRHVRRRCRAALRRQRAGRSRRQRQRQARSGGAAAVHDSSSSGDSKR
jgi:hypothetical protein